MGKERVKKESNYFHSHSCSEKEIPLSLDPLLHGSMAWEREIESREAGFVYSSEAAGLLSCFPL